METGTAQISSGELIRTDGNDTQEPQRYRGMAGVRDVIRISGASFASTLTSSSPISTHSWG